MENSVLYLQNKLNPEIALKFNGRSYKFLTHKVYPLCAKEFIALCMHEKASE